MYPLALLQSGYVRQSFFDEGYIVIWRYLVKRKNANNCC
jgi:hypothetical protein